LTKGKKTLLGITQKVRIYFFGGPSKIFWQGNFFKEKPLGQGRDLDKQQEDLGTKTQGKKEGPKRRNFLRDHYLPPKDYWGISNQKKRKRTEIRVFGRIFTRLRVRRGGH